MPDGKQKLVIVESPRRGRSRATWAPSTRSSRASDTSATCPRRQARFRREARSTGRSAWRWRTTSSRTTSSTPTRRKLSPASRRNSAQADELLLATDEDREGEAIAWHLVQALQPKAGAPHGLPRDHEGRDRPRARGDERRGRAARRLAGDAPHPRPAVRLRGIPRALEEGCAACRRVVCSRSPRGSSSTESWSACASSWRRTGTLSACSSLAPSKRDWLPSTASALRRVGTSAAPARRTTRFSSWTRNRRPLCPGSRRPAVRRHVRRGQALPAQPGRSVPHLHASAGGEPEAALLLADDHADRPTAVRERLHHVHAH